MIRNAHDFENLDSESAILQVLESVVARRAAGELIPDESVIAAHPNLGARLVEKLASLHQTEIARTLADHVQPRPGQTERDMFRGYQLGEVVGRGASGIVYRAVQNVTGREVAIKVMIQGPFEEEADEARFEREARILAQLEHRNIVTVYDTGWSNGRFFLVMDYVDGHPLDQWLKLQDVSLERKLGLFAEIAESVHAAHLRGVIHRDLKPSNIRVDEAGIPHLLDFGLAKVVPSRTSQPGDPSIGFGHTMTQTGQFVGSLPWASPEQAAGEPDKVDIRTDIYSLGVLFFHALAGKFPYPVIGNIRDVIDRILTADAPRLRSIDPGIDNEVETIIASCLQKDRERRYQSAGDLAADIRRRLEGEPIAARRDSSWYVIRRTLRRHRWGAAVGVGVALLTVAYAATMSVFYKRAQADAMRARRTLTFLQDTLFQASAHRMGSGATLAEVLDEAASRIPAEFAGQPELEAALQSTLGTAYESIWNKEKGVRHLQRGLDLHRQAFGPTHEDTIRNQIQLGAALADIGDRASVDMLREAVSLARALDSVPDIIVADALGKLAYSLWAAAQPPRWGEAGALYNESIELFQKLGAKASPDSVQTLVSQASMSRALGRGQLAESQYRDACTLANRVLGESHQFALECMIGLSDVLVDLDRTDEAQATLNAIIPLAERQFGSRIMPSILRRTAYIQMARNELENAEKSLFEIQALACDRLAVQEKDPEKLRSLAAALRDRVGRKGADAAFLDSLTASQIAFPEPLEAARSLVALGQIRFRQERYAGAEMHLRRCLESLSHVPSPQFSIRVRAGRMLASSLQMLGRPDEAEAILKDLYYELNSAFGPQDSRTRAVAGNLVILFQRSGREDQAKLLLPSLQEPTK